MAGDNGLIRTDTGLFLDKGNQVFDVRHTDFASGAKTDKVTDATEAVKAAMTAAISVGGVVYVPENVLFDYTQLTADNVTYLMNYSSYSDGNYGSSHINTNPGNTPQPALKIIKKGTVTGIGALDHVDHTWHILEIVGDATPVTDARADGVFNIVSIGSRANPQADEGKGVDQVIANGLYMEMRSDANVATRAYGAEAACTVWSSGSINTARGISGTAQIAAPDNGGVVGTGGSGAITFAVGGDFSASIVGAITGTITTGYGVQGAVHHGGSSTMTTARLISMNCGMTGSGTITSLFGLDQTWSGLTTGTITSLRIIHVRDPSSPGSTITNLYGLQVEKLSGPTNRKTAHFQGPVHITGGEFLGFDGGSSWDTTANKTRIVYESSELRFYDNTQANPALALAGTAAVVTAGFGCNGASAQTAVASGGVLNSYATGAFGLDSDANMSSMHALVVSIRAALVANGTMS